ncbi:MAG: lipoprotein-releasing ABC transporter permease subunit [Pseudomonadota bacterium]
MLKSISLIAVRYLGAGRRTQFSSFVSLVSILGIALGVAVLIIVTSVMNGFEQEVRKHVLGMTAHATVLYPGQPMVDWQRAAAKLDSNPQVSSTSPFIRGGAMLSHKGEVHGAIVQGIDLALEENVSEIGKYISAADKHKIADGAKQILLGYQLREKLNVEIGQRLVVIAPRFSASAGIQAPVYLTYTVAGEFHIGMHEFDASMALVNISDAQHIFSMTAGVSGLRVKFANADEAPFLAREIAGNLDPPAASINWTQYHRNFFQALKSQKRIMFVILSIIVAVAAFNIVAAMIMLVKEKSADIAILRTLGMSRTAVMCIFVIQGSLVGLIGVMSGIVLGIVGTSYSGEFVARLERWLDIQFIKPDVYYIDYLPAVIGKTDVAVIGITAGIITILATLYPAWRASLTDPAEALRYEGV